MLILCSQEVSISFRSCILSKILGCTTKTEDVDDNSDITFPGSESLLRFCTVFVLYNTKHAKTSKSLSKRSDYKHLFWPQFCTTYLKLAKRFIHLITVFSSARRPKLIRGTGPVALNNEPRFNVIKHRTLTPCQSPTGLSFLRPPFPPQNPNLRSTHSSRRLFIYFCQCGIV